MKRFSICVLLAACGGDDAATPDAAPQFVFGGDRPTELQVPDDLASGETYPLVLLLHGHSVNGLVQQAYLKLGDLVDRRGVFMLAPDGTVNETDGHTFWNTGAGCCNHGDFTPDDVAYLGGLVEDVTAAWPIDPARVYVWGHSNGGFMAFRMACDRADLFTGIAPLAGGAMPVDDCDPSRTVNVLDVHGTDDAVIPYAGGDFGEGAFPGAVESVARWQELDGCAATRTAGEPRDLEVDLDGAETTVEIADDCPAGGAVELWTMVGASHIPDVDPTFGDQVLDWMLAHPRP